MKFYLAPMEGITGYVYRNVYNRYFGKIDKYFTPFIATTQHGKLTSRELNDILPEHNRNMHVVPQILSNNADDFKLTVEKLVYYGYDEVNLNLGCPSGTVVAKGKGSGFLAYPEALKYFLEQVFNENDIRLSVKTRLGVNHANEFIKLVELFNEYPLEELIIHPRRQIDYYKHAPDWEMFEQATGATRHTVGYNGDIGTIEDYRGLQTRFPSVENIMIGRGIIRNPNLVPAIYGINHIEQTMLRQFHDALYHAYTEILSGERNILFKMKEIWFYMIEIFPDAPKYIKKIRKAQTLKGYLDLVDELFEREIIAD